MTLPFSHRSPTLLARSALLALVLAAGAGTAASQSLVGAAPAPTRTAVLAGPDASAAAVDRAVQSSSAPVTLRRVGGSLEAQASATALAAEGYGAVIGVGPAARAAVAQAAAGEVGDGTRWGVGR